MRHAVWRRAALRMSRVRNDLTNCSLLENPIPITCFSAARSPDCASMSHASPASGAAVALRTSLTLTLPIMTEIPITPTVPGAPVSMLPRPLADANLLRAWPAICAAGWWRWARPTAGRLARPRPSWRQAAPRLAQAHAQPAAAGPAVSAAARREGLQLRSPGRQQMGG
jgi:hypothetical protein